MDTAAALSRDDLDFLARPLFGILSVAAGPTPPQPRPVWFEATPEGTIQLFTGPDTLKVRRLRHDPHASLLVVAPVGERERWVSITGHTSIETEGAHDLLARLFARYWGAAARDRTDELTGMLSADWVRIVLHPDTVQRFSN